MTHELELTITVGRCVGRAACAVQVGTDRGWTSWDPSNILTPLTLGSNHINVQPLVLLVLRSPCRLTGEGEANCSQLSAHQPQTMRPQLKQAMRLQLGSSSAERFTRGKPPRYGADRLHLRTPSAAWASLEARRGSPLTRPPLAASPARLRCHACRPMAHGVRHCR
eukprot:CAMPEP_0181183804 /NCGR_PEP_ID=MMETSP1096-20121128/8623_1 /TAXON_ID=156174 ORGANISM="Chrysochromulina ericina, Strain CCMP281" /NCGR_SAMPLE_ID=MMETSP1096 /ASSEMBLY_ACC=CAM_ASM_000453 /LENGTH=165 /DNA_ID=CAMNT_0023272513 /DNA_START=132 /DNA_END=626 /DNA_ORIENTATION=+